MDWRESVTTMTDKVFPGLSHNNSNKYFDNEMTSNLPLQMVLYFNVVLAPLWFLIIVVFLAEKYTLYNELYKFIIVAVFLTILALEVFRLYLGYEGNLQDKIPELAGFWMLSLLLQFPLQGFLLFNPYFCLGVTELTIQSIMFTLLLAQLVTGYLALKYTASQQAAYFRIMKLKTTSSHFQDRYKVM